MILENVLESCFALGGSTKESIEGFETLKESLHYLRADGNCVCHFRSRKELRQGKKNQFNLTQIRFAFQQELREFEPSFQTEFEDSYFEMCTISCLITTLPSVNFKRP